MVQNNGLLEFEKFRSLMRNNLLKNKDLQPRKLPKDDKRINLNRLKIAEYKM